MQPHDRLAPDRAISVVREAWRREEAEGFPHLRPLPSTSVRRFLEYWERLAPAEREVLRTALASRGTIVLGMMPGALAGDEARVFKAWVDHGLLGRPERPGDQPAFSPMWMPLRWARNLISAARTDPMAVSMIAAWDPELVERISATESAKAAGLRKAIKPLLAQRFGLKPANSSGGVWTYTREDDPLRLQVDYGGRSQLRYWVRTPGGPPGFAANLEGIFGLMNDWDWIAESETEAAASLLADGVDYVMALSREVAS